MTGATRSGKRSAEPQAPRTREDVANLRAESGTVEVAPDGPTHAASSPENSISSTRLRPTSAPAGAFHGAPRRAIRSHLAQNTVPIPAEAIRTLRAVSATSSGDALGGRYSMRNAQIGRSEMPLAPGPIATRTWLAKDTSTREATELHEEAVAHAKCRRWDLALEQALRAVHLDSGDPEFEATYAWVLYQAGPPRRETDAQIAAHLNRALKLDRECARAHYVLGLLRKRQDKHEAAEVHFRRALDSDPDHVEAEREMRLYSRRRASRPKSGVVQRVVETLTGKRERGSFRPDGDD